jgi:tetratricopeptide (TPR) repeat protein
MVCGRRADWRAVAPSVGVSGTTLSTEPANSFSATKRTAAFTICIVKVLVAVAMLSVMSADAVADERTILRLRGWIDAVDTHAAGDTDRALAVVTAWTYDDLELMRPYVEALVLAPSEGNSDRSKRRRRLARDDTPVLAELTRSLQSRGDFDVFRKRAAMLHTDAAILGPGPEVVSPPSPLAPRSMQDAERRVIVKSLDGQVQYFEQQNLHWELAMDVLDSLPAKPARDPFVGDWYRAVGAYFAQERRFADAMVHFDRARELVPDHAGVLYGEACLQETLGAPRIQNYVRVTTLPNGLFIEGVSSPQTHYRRAESLLRKALAGDPDLVEASLRLGRVLTRQDRSEEALPHLRKAIASATSSATTYYAHLFMGDAAQALGRPDEARRHYEHAIAVFPESQAAPLALGFVLRSLGDRAAARSAIDPALNPLPRSADDDPWWQYYDGDAGQVGRLLEALRAPFMKPR